MKRVAIYVNQTSEQSAGLERELKDFIADQDDWEYAGSYIDKGYSGMNINRSAMNRMIADSLKGKLDIVLVDQYKHITRDMQKLFSLIQILSEKGVIVYSKCDNRIIRYDSSEVYSFQGILEQAKKNTKE